VRCTITEHLLRLIRPLAIAGETILSRRVWVFIIEDGDTRVGYGEAAPLPGFGGEDPAACAAALGKAMAAMTDDVVHAWFARERADAALGHKLEACLRAAPCARHAVESALLDLMAQRQAKPLADLLAGEAVEPRVPVNALLEGDSSFAVLTRAKELLGQGFDAFKLKSTGDPRKDADRLRALRENVGPVATLRLDVNAAWTMEQATAFAEASQGCELEYCEQPLAAADLAGHAQLRKLGHRIALDESVREPGDVARIAAAQAADVVVLKPQFLGGWRATKQAAELAQSHGIGVVLTSALDGAIGRATAAHMAAALGLRGRAHGLATGDLFEQDLVVAPLPLFAGALHLERTPGLGAGKLRADKAPAVTMRKPEAKSRKPEGGI